MISAIDLYNILRSKLEDKEAKILVEFVATHIDQKREHNKDFVGSVSDLRSVKADVIKWMFIFWIGQVTINLALLVLFLK